MNGLLFGLGSWVLGLGSGLLFAAVLLCALLLPAAPALAQANDPAPGPTAGAKILDKPDAQVPLDLQFSDESGQTVKLGDYFQPNRPVLLVMVYFGCPQLCSLSLNGVTKAVRKIEMQPGRQFEIVTVSFNPKEDAAMAAAKKANYIKSLGKPEAAAGWHFLTSSDPSAAKTLGDAIGFGFRLNPEDGAILARGRHLSLHARGPRVAGRTGRRVRCGSAPRFVDPRLAGKDQFGPVRRGPGLRDRTFRRANRKIHVGRHDHHAGHGNYDFDPAGVGHRLDGLPGFAEGSGDGAGGNDE